MSGGKGKRNHTHAHVHTGTTERLSERVITSVSYPVPHYVTILCAVQVSEVKGSCAGHIYEVREHTPQSYPYTGERCML